MADSQTLTLPVLPLTTGVILPQMVVTIAVESPEARAATEAVGADGRLLLVPKIDGNFAKVGVVAKIESSAQLASGMQALVVRALHRARVGTGVVGATSALWLEAEPVPDPSPTEEHKAAAAELRATLRVLLDRAGNPRLIDMLGSVDDPGALADSAGWWPDLPIERKIELLETLDVRERLGKVLGWAKQALAELDMAEKISGEVREGMEQNQREFLLRQQLAAIRKELGEDGEDDVVGQYRERLESKPDLPEAVRNAIEREIDRLERTSPQAMEHGWMRTWLDTVLDLPWAERSTDDYDLTQARAVLDADHHGLEEVKDRIVEELAVRKLRAERGEPEAEGGERRATILALVGPPGVGKTSLGQSVARALGRSFVRVALGGIHDEAEIRGHRRTYVGAQPGRIVRALTEAGTMNPVFLLDEIDKVGTDWRGDPASALLEVLDPAQNHSFRDHYLEIDLDLSEVLFIATANMLETIPAPLLDRVEVVQLDGYTEEEKVAIARDHLLGRVATHTGLRDGEVTVTTDALHRIVASYTREAGVRGLERQLAKLLRKAATRIAGEPGEPGNPAAPRGAPLVIDADDVKTYLGRPKFHPEEVAERTARPGVATGLAVTGAGGDVLFVEATALPGHDEPGGEPGLTVTGQLGDVMKESARIALSYVRSHGAELELPPGADRRPVHIHFPAGAIPKDGPSAGITMTTALASLLTGRPVKGTVGMTGEVTLQGRVLPIGGVKQKVLAAHRAGLTDVVLPGRNEPDLEDLPESVRQAMTFHLTDDVAEVLRLSLEPAAEPVAVGGSPADGPTTALAA